MFLILMRILNLHFFSVVTWSTQQLLPSNGAQMYFSEHLLSLLTQLIQQARTKTESMHSQFNLFAYLFISLDILVKHKRKIDEQLKIWTLWIAQRDRHNTHRQRNENEFRVLEVIRNTMESRETTHWLKVPVSLAPVMHACSCKTINDHSGAHASNHYTLGSWLLCVIVMLISMRRTQASVIYDVTVVLWYATFVPAPHIWGRIIWMHAHLDDAVAIISAVLWPISTSILFFATNDMKSVHDFVQSTVWGTTLQPVCCEWMWCPIQNRNTNELFDYNCVRRVGAAQMFRQSH